MHEAFLTRRVRELLPVVVDPKVREHKGGQSGTFVCTIEQRMRAVFYDFSAYITRKSPEQVALEIVAALKN